MRARAGLLAVTAVLLAGCSSTVTGTGSPGRAGLTPTPTPPSSNASSAPPTTSAAQSSTSAGTPSPTVHPVPAHPLRTVTVTAGAATYLIKIWATRTDTDCVQHAHGAVVVAYLQSHPCRSMTRVLATSVVGGRAIGFNEANIGFTGADTQAAYSSAGGFRIVVTANGTGNLNDLLAEGYRLPSGPTSLPDPDAFAAFAQDAGVGVYDVWYLSGATPENDPALERFAQDTWLQF